MNHIFEEIALERKRQDEKWGKQNHPMTVVVDRNMLPPKSFLMDRLKTCKHRNEHEGKPKCWYYILEEEVCEAFLETDPVKAKEKFIKVCAVGVQIIEALDRQIEGGKG